MLILNSIEMNQVSGGLAPYVAPLIAIGAGIEIYNGGADLINSTNTYNALGQVLGERTFDLMNPDVTGKMTYRETDFK